MNKMKRLTGRKILLGSCGILCIWFCKGAGHADNAEYLTIDAGQSPGNSVG